MGCHSGRSVSHNINGEMVKVSAFMGMRFKYPQNTNTKELIERPRGYLGVRKIQWGWGGNVDML